MVPIAKLTARANLVLSLAQEERARLYHDRLGPEHMFLGLVRIYEGRGAHVLRALGVDLPRARDAVEYQFCKGEKPLQGERSLQGEMGLNDQARRIIELAIIESHGQMVDTEHLLLALVREEGVVVVILERLNVRPEQVQTGITRTQSPLFDRYTERARRVLAMSQEEALRRGASLTRPEHILLGLAREGDGLAAKVLKRLGLSFSKIRLAVDGRRTNRGGQVPVLTNQIILDDFDKRAQWIIQQAVREGQGLNHHYIGTEHLLLALTAQRGGVAKRALKLLRVSNPDVRRSVLRILNQRLPKSGS